MQPTLSLGVAELTETEMEQLVGGEDSCWCKGFVRAIGYGIGYALGEFVDALVSPEDSNSFLGK